MKERPIIMSTDSVRAILAGTKTQTRRVMNPPPEPIGLVAPKKLKCPFGTRGDRLWVKEAFASGIPGCWEHQKGILYRADHQDQRNGDGPLNMQGLWKSPLFMPRRASRIVLEITKVGYQRLWSMWHHDARDEGYGYHPDCLKWYQEAWDKLNAKRGFPWESNPWVWVVKFKRIALDKPAADC